MAYLELRCVDCRSEVELAVEPEDVIKGFLCPNEECGKDRLQILKYVDTDDRGLGAALAELSLRLSIVEEFLQGQSEEGAEMFERVKM